MKTFLVAFDNLVTDDGPIIMPIKAVDLNDCYDQAWRISKKTGFSEGNFEVFVSDMDLDSLTDAKNVLLDGYRADAVDEVYG